MTGDLSDNFVDCCDEGLVVLSIGEAGTAKGEGGTAVSESLRADLGMRLDGSRVMILGFPRKHLSED